MPESGEMPTDRELVMRLGAFLAELTSNRSAGAVHADILARAGEPDSDPRLAGLADLERFAAMWIALGIGSALPEDAWQCVVLPTVVAFSGPQDRKAHLEQATGQWMAASTAVAGRPAGLTTGEGGELPDPPPEPFDSAWPARLSSLDANHSAPKSLPGRALRGALAVATVAAVLAVAGVLWWSQDRLPFGDLFLPPIAPADLAGQPVSASPSGVTASAEAVPLENAAAPPLSTQPLPAPTWSGSGPITAPTAPQDLAVIGASSTAIALSWRPPADGGTGGLAYYRIWRDGADAGWTTRTGGTVTGLSPATTYTFTVTAHNGAGSASPPSNQVTAGTSPSQSQQIPPPARQTPIPPTTSTRPSPPAGNPTLLTNPRTYVTFGDSFNILGTGWPCTAPASINITLGGKLVAIADVNAQGGFRTPIAVDASQPDAPTVAVIDGGTLVLTRATWVITAHLPAQPSCSAAPDRSVRVAFR